jgi:hypothetical protein
MILEHRDDWIREILVIGPPRYIRELERDYLVAIDAQNDPSSFNRNNATGIMSFAKGSLNPMADPIVKQKVIDKHTGDNHWARKLNGKTHPQIGQKRPTITGDNHPNKRPEIAAKISEAHKGRKHPYQIGNANPMRDAVTVAKLSGENHWVNKEENKRSCSCCGIENISKSNYTRWHGENCKHKGK